MTIRGGRGPMRALLLAIVTCAACAHPQVAPSVMPADGDPGREQDRLELGSRFNTVGPQRPGLYRDGEPIALDEFLRVSGHAGLADDIATRRWLKRGMIAGGAFTLIGAIAYVTTGDCDTSSAACMEDKDRRYWYGLGVGLVGAGLVIGGIELSTLRPSWTDLSRWAAAHNRAYRIPPRSAVRIAPVAHAGGGGVIMSGEF